VPPSVVLKIVPLCPTAVPLFASVKETLRISFVVPLVCGAQVVPPSVVLKIVPLCPTAVPLFASVKETLRNKLFV
jgi:hypothetical protein